eukprot:XP_001700125.1 predicted protein [Chlamydomonas reinhardtii]
MPVVFALMSEFCPPNTRGKFMAMLASFWMVGSLYSAAMGWLIIPRLGWRAFVDILTHKAALTTDAAGHPHARDAAGDTESLLPSYTPATSGGSSSGAAGAAASLSATRRLGTWTSAVLGRAWGVLTALLSPPLRGQTLALGVGWIGLCGGWYCTVLWVPRYFEARGATGGSVYGQTFAVAMANLPGNLASIYLVDRLGRRLTACACMAGACVCALAFAAAPASGPWPLLAACVFNGVSVGGWNSLDMISAELYPTSLRSSGFGLLNAVGRVSSFVTTYAAGALLDLALWAPLVVAAALLAAGSAAMLSLPEPAGKPLEDSFCDEDKVQEAHSNHGGGGGGRGRSGLASGASSDDEGAGSGNDRSGHGISAGLLLGGGGGGGGGRRSAEKVGLLAAAKGQGL